MDSKNLYRWKRWSTPPTASMPTMNSNTYEKKKTKVSSNDDIQDWIKKVEKASDRAAAVTFGRDNFSVANGYATAAATLEALHDHDEAHSEAQDLLSQWMAQKCGLDDNREDDDLMYFEDDDDIRQYSASKRAAKSELKGQWHSMLVDNDPVGAGPYSNLTSEELFHEIETRDDDQAVRSILSDLMEKDLVETKLRKDLGLGGETATKKHDPRATMAARQQKVRENREKRQQMKETQLRQQQHHKDAKSQARQLVMKEERSKAVQRQREEALIQQEMARLRKEMREQRRQGEESRQREKDLEDRRNEELRREEAAQRREDLQTRLKAESLIEEERRKMTQKLEDMHVLKASQDLKTLQRHFHAWYQLVLTKQLALGKVRALSDWRTLLRAWNAWRAYVRASLAERETKEIEESFKDLHRKNQMATDHFRMAILKKYFQVWCHWVRQERHGKELTEQQNQTKSKMAAFLEAAASGKLWTNRSKEERTDVGSAKEGRKEAPDRPDSVAQKLDDLFKVQTVLSQANPIDALNTTRSDTSTISNKSNESLRPHHNPTGKPGKPKYAWQVTRKHVDLPIEDILTAGNDEGDFDGVPQPNRNQNNATQDDKLKSKISSFGQKKSINYKMNSFEHRYAAQQRILHEQQHQLREQKRLIEDLQTAQKQQLLRMELGECTGSPRDILTDERSEIAIGTGSSTAKSDHSDSSSTSAGDKTKEIKRPPLLKGMKEREAVRLKLKAEREDRQRQKEQEKLAEIKAKEERQREEEEVEKRAKMEKRREEKRLAKQRELEKQQRVEHQRLENSRADEHYTRTLLRQKGLDPWLRLMDLTKQNMQVAEDHHNSLLLRRCLSPWRRHTEEVVRERVAVADQLYEVILIRRAFESWKRYGHLQSIQLQKARRHYIHNLKLRIFQAWQRHVTDEKLRTWRNEEAAEEHNEMRLVKTAFLAWKSYPKILKAEQLREKRLQDMRKKVASILPDFGTG